VNKEDNTVGVEGCVFGGGFCEELEVGRPVQLVGREVGEHVKEPFFEDVWLHFLHVKGKGEFGRETFFRGVALAAGDVGGHEGMRGAGHVERIGVGCESIGDRRLGCVGEFGGWDILRRVLVHGGALMHAVVCVWWQQRAIARLLQQGRVAKMRDGS